MSKSCLTCAHKDVCSKRFVFVLQTFVLKGRYSEIENAQNSLDIGVGCENWDAVGLVPDIDRTYTVTEVCPHSESEVEMRRNTDTMGCKAFCPVCDERRHTEGVPRCNYNSRLDCCRHNPPMPADLTPHEVPPALRVETPLGALVVKVEADPGHPGIYIDLRRPDADDDMPLAMVEFSEDDSDLPEGEANIITRIWRDGMQDSYTDRIVHQNIEEYFRVEGA